MSCLIKDGKYYDNKGNESRLYKDLVDKVGESQAHELFVLAQTPTFKSVNTKEEPTAQEVIDYAQDNFALAEPLTAEEILDLSTLQIDNVENSEDLYDVLYNAFYKDNLFSPQVKKLKKIYTETELTNILENSDIQARIKETIEKLRFTEPFEIQQIPKDNDYGYNDLVINIIGQYKSNNPIQDRELFEPQGTEVEVIGEDGQPIENQLIYDNAVKVVDNPEIYDAIDAIIAAPQEIKTDKVEKRVINWLKNYGLDISNLTRNNYTKLKTFLLSPTKENTIALEESLGFIRSPKKEYYNIETPLDRTYQALRTTKTEQELFDELSLIKTNTPNVYHKIEKIDEQEMRNIMKNQDLTVPLYELYKEYFGYSDTTNDAVNTNIEGINEGATSYINYLTTEFVADFAAQKIKNKDNDFYNQFKITEKGIELISQDEITLQKVKSQIANHPQLADYSLLSKNLPNLKEDNPLRIQTKQDRRIQAANNIQALPTPSSQITILDENYLEALNETAEFLRVGDDIYEQQEKGVYGRLQFEKNPNYFTFNIEAPPLKEIEVKNTALEATKVKKLTDNQTKDENFGCL